jgi:hypothetical protein
LTLQEILFGRKIGRLKRPKREVRHGKQGSDRPGVAAASAASPGQASPTINWIDPSREISGVILMQVLPFADNKCRPTFAAFGSSVCALLDAAQKAA